MIVGCEHRGLGAESVEVIALCLHDYKEVLMRPLIAAMAIAIMLSGCAAPPTAGQATPTPSNRLLAYQGKDEGAESTITVLRQMGSFGPTCYLSVYIDGKLAARMDDNEVASFHVQPGSKLIGIGMDPMGSGICSSGSSQPRREVETYLGKGEQRKFRFVTQSGLEIRPASY